MDIVVALGTMSAAVTAFVEFVRSILLRFDAYSVLDEQTQSIILQIIAAIAGVVSAFALGVNLLDAVPAFAEAPYAAGAFFTGLVASTGSAGIHALLALLGVRGNVTAIDASRTIETQSGTRIVRHRYAPFL